MPASGNSCASRRIAPAAVEGPNQLPTSLPSSLPASAMRWTLNGQSGEGESRNQVRIRTYVAYSGVNVGWTGFRQSRPRWRCTSALARSDCPVRSIHPHPESLVHPFSGSDHHFVLLGEAMTSEIDEMDGPPSVVGVTGSSCWNEVSRMGGKELR